MMTETPLNHIERPLPPWSHCAPKTQCGRARNDVAAIVSIAEFAASVKRDGQQRIAYTTCMTCWSATTSQAYEWDQEPNGTMMRYLTSARQDDKRMIQRELRALACLVDAYRDEFDALVIGLTAVRDIEDST